MSEMKFENPAADTLRMLLEEAESGQTAVLGYIMVDREGTSKVGTALGTVSTAHIVTALGCTSLLDQELKARLSEFLRFVEAHPEPETPSE